MANYSFIIEFNGRNVYQSAIAANVYKRANNFWLPFDLEKDEMRILVVEHWGFFDYKVVDEYCYKSLVEFAANWTSKKFFNSLFD